MTDSPEPKRRILVIGGAGYVGSVLARILLDSGHGVRVMDSFLYNNTFSIESLYGEPGFGFVKGDIRRPADIELALEGVNDVVLLASLVGDPISRKYPELTWEINYQGSINVFQALAAADIDGFVFTSTCSNYGLRPSEAFATEDAQLKPLSLYAESKVDFENYILENAAAVDFCPTILRIATAYGLSPRMRFDLTIADFTRKLAMGRSLTVYDKDTWRPYCHVRDIARAILQVLQAPLARVRGEVFNVGCNDENYTKATIVDLITRHVNAEVRYKENDVDPRNYRVSFDKIATTLGFRTDHAVPTHIPTLIEALRSGLYARAEEMSSYYGNHEIAE